MERPMTYEASSETVMEPGPLSSPKGDWRDYVIVTKPSIVVSNLLTTFGGFWLASKSFAMDDFGLRLFLTLLGATLVMAAGCVLNNYVDRDIDPNMIRTNKRPTVVGRINPRNVFWYGISLAVVGFGTLGLFVNVPSAMMALIGLFFYVIIYTIWLKRTSTLNTVVGGVSGAMPPVIGYVAVSGQMDAVAWILFIFLFLWQPPHFLALAMRRCEEYRAAGIPMLPVVRGFEETKRQMLIWAAVLVPASLLLYALGVVGIVYFVLALILGLVWVGLLISGFYVKDDIVWARKMFLYSLIYLTVLFNVMIFNSTM
jgi:protoheme IX farnesyltransferase